MDGCSWIVQLMDLCARGQGSSSPLKALLERLRARVCGVPELARDQLKPHRLSRGLSPPPRPSITG